MAIGSKWSGKLIKDCDICKKQIQYTFVDGRTSNGRWCIMCPTCRLDQGCIELGVGLGQKYERKAGTYVRTA